jgi:hypothetical protein
MPGTPAFHKGEGHEGFRRNSSRTSRFVRARLWPVTATCLILPMEPAMPAPATMDSSKNAAHMGYCQPAN